ncbi:hypothetical protein K491DRAFT_723562 [Lophiostoma macrostomum CBS 122681]|uniref:Uncharacterized protein n=1 Tax=Lophiostoma macrostomum CBS 122681 TaxID=1314788 RepID=A0A6A6SMA3_9PLEO|nr:hypothetical protein K491DRAFT_723562 [Lophiostoma macrostomum CBS 122681]
MVTFSAWIWSAEQGQHYCAVYDDQGQLVSYRWQSGHVQPAPPAYVSSTTDSSSAQKAQGLGDDLRCPADDGHGRDEKNGDNVGRH